MIQPEGFFQNLAETLAKPRVENSLFVLYGDDAFLTKRLKNQIRSLNFDLSTHEIKKTGPDADLLDACSGTSLFVSQSAVWITKLTSPQSWRKDAQKTWEQMTGLLESGDLKVFLQSGADKAYTSPLFEKATSVLFEVEPSKKRHWLNLVNSEKKNPISSEKIQYLASLDEDLLTLENSVELWSLGGDLWAEKSLGWSGAKMATKNAKAPAYGASDNLAYLWVDATLSAKTDQAIRLLNQIESQEPLMLLGLLAKSVKILAQIELGVESFKSEPPFLVNKLKKLKASHVSSGLNNRGRKLLKACAKADLQMKTTRVDPMGLLARLSER